MSEATGTQQTRQSQELTIFHDVAKALTSSLDLDSILQTIMEKMAEYFRPDTWSLLMVDEQRGELYFAIAVGEAAEGAHQREPGDEHEDRVGDRGGGVPPERRGHVEPPVALQGLDEVEARLGDAPGTARPAPFFRFLR